MLKKSLAFVLAFAACLGYGEAAGGGFVGTNGTHFVLNGKPFYFNGFNAYWMMYMASDNGTRSNVTDTLAQASVLGMNVARTWAFSDGDGYRALQTSPGVYDENTFKGLDFVVSEAKKHGLYLILSLVNNWSDYGGKAMYVKWTNSTRANLTKADEFFTNNFTKSYYKNHVKAVLTRINTITGVAYKDDPTILAWELMNEPRCPSDLSGKAIQDWVTEMSAHVKSIDNKHLLEIGLEGYYGPEKKQNYPSNFQVGTDFISNNKITHVDFATIHLYPNVWLPNSTESVQAAFVTKWMNDHLNDSDMIIGKPILVTEFGKSKTSKNYNAKVRDTYFRGIYKFVYDSASSGGAGAGSLFWQVMAVGMANWDDGYAVILEQSNSTDKVISHQSKQMASLNGRQ